MKNKRFSEAVAPICFIAFFLIAAIVKCSGQNQIVTVPGRFAITTPDPKWYDLKTYHPFTPARVTRNVFSIGTGVLRGMGEALWKNPMVYEQNYHVAPTSFLGSQAWRRQYDASGHHKPDAFNFTRDLHHMDNFAAKYVNASIYLTIGLSKTKYSLRDVIVDALTNSILNTAATAITFSSVSKSRLFYF